MSVLGEEIEKEKKRAARVEEARQKGEERKKAERQKEEERKKEGKSQEAEESQKEKAENTQDTADVATVVDEKAEGDGEKVSATKSIPRMGQSTDTIEQQPPQFERLVGNHIDAEEEPEATRLEDEDDQPISAHALSLVKAITSAKQPTSEGRPSSTCEAEHVEGEETEAEHTKVEVETTLLLQGVDDEIATAATGLQATTQLTKDALEAMLGPKNPNKAIKHWLPKETRDGTKGDEEEEGDDWTHISNESREATEVAPTA